MAGPSPSRTTTRTSAEPWRRSGSNSAERRPLPDGEGTTAIFTVPQKDKSGAGANFLVEGVADQPVNEPLIESIMKDLAGNVGLSFLSQGRVIREMK